MEKDIIELKGKIQSFEFYKEKSEDVVLSVAKEIAGIKNDKEVSKRLNDDKLNQLKKQYNEKYGMGKIKNLIMFVSYSASLKNKDKSEKTALEKDIEIFDPENIILLYSEQSEEIASELVYEYKNRKVFKQKIENDSLDAGYSYIKKLISGEELEDEIYSEKEIKIKAGESIIDATLGHKLVSISLYKAAVEERIKVIDWVQQQVIYKKKLYRVPGLIELKEIEEVKRESEALYNQIKSSKKKMNYDLVSELYQTINKKIETYFYKSMGVIFSFSSFINVGKFINNIDKEKRKLNKKKIFEKKIEFDDFRLIFKIDKFDKEVQLRVYYFLKNIYMKKIYENDYVAYLQSIDGSIDEKEKKLCGIKEVLENKELKSEESYEFIIKKIKEGLNKDFRDKLDKNDYDDLLEFEDLYYSEENKFLKDNKLLLESIGVEIDIENLEDGSKLKDLIKTKAIHCRMIKDAFRNKQISLQELEDKEESNQRKIFSNLKDFVKEINREVNDILEKNNKEKRELLILESKNERKKYYKLTLKVNDEFYF